MNAALRAALGAAAWAAAVIGAVAALGWAAFLLMLALSPLSYRLLPRGGRKEFEGVSDIESAVAKCRATGLSGFELLAYTQALASRRFEYSRRNHWDGFEKAFERGMGYCYQQAGALKLLLERLGFAVRMVQAFPCEFPAHEVNGQMSRVTRIGHAWLKVGIDGRELDVCCDGPDNSPGKVHFRTIGKVTDLGGTKAALAHVGSVAVNVALDLPAVLGWRRP